MMSQDTDFSVALQKAKEIARMLAQKSTPDEQPPSHSYEQPPMQSLAPSQMYSQPMNSMAAQMQSYQQGKRLAEGSGGEQEDIVMIPNATVGYIIGRKGETLREIEAATGTRLRIDPGK